MNWYFEETKSLAEDGDADAQRRLGNLYNHGDEVPQNYNEAVKWYRKAAEQGDAEAQGSLGMMYETGEGVPQDYDEAIKLYRKAAEQGDAFSQSSLGQMYRDGKGVAKDLIHAYAWLNVAQANGYESADIFKQGLGLTPEQVAEAQALSAEIYKRIEANKKD